MITLGADPLFSAVATAVSGQDPCEAARNYAIAYPTVAKGMNEEYFAGLARDCASGIRPLDRASYGITFADKAQCSNAVAMVRMDPMPWDKFASACGACAAVWFDTSGAPASTGAILSPQVNPIVFNRMAPLINSSPVPNPQTATQLTLPTTNVFNMSRGITATSVDPVTGQNVAAGSVVTEVIPWYQDKFVLAAGAVGAVVVLALFLRR